MNVNGKVILIVILGGGACLASSLLGHYFSEKTRNNQRFQYRIEQLTESVEILPRLSGDFIQSGNPYIWKDISQRIESLLLGVTNASPDHGPGEQALQTLSEKITGYYHLLTEIHDPALRFNEDKKSFQRIGLTFSTEIEERIISPYRKDEGLMSRQAANPVKIQIKDTAYDLLNLHNQQQILMTSFLIDWDFAGYRQKMETIVAKMESCRAKLHDLNESAADELDLDRVIASIERKLDDLFQYEKQFADNFSKVDDISGQMAAQVEELLQTCSQVSSEIISGISRTDSINQKTHWALGISIFFILSLLGVMLAKDVIRSVEDLKESREKYRTSENLLRSITGNVPGVVYQFVATREFEYSFSFISQKTMEILGLESDPETFFKEFANHVFDDERERFLNSVQDAVERIALWNYEGRFNRPDGKVIWFSGNSVPRDEGNRIVFDGVIMDITRRKEMESALRRTQFCFDHAAIGIYQIGMDGRILDVNRYAAEMLGYTIEELKELSTFDIDPFINKETMNADLDKIVVDDRGMFETVHIRKDDSRIDVEVSGNILEYEGKQHSFSFVKDITERKRNEASLRLTQFIFDKAPIGIWRIGEMGEIIDVNEQGCKSLGYTREELRRMTVFDISPGLEKVDVERNDRVLERTGTGILETNQQRKNGESFPIQRISKLMYFKNQKVRVAFIQDISERKRAEAALRENERLLGNILESMDEAVAMVDCNYKYKIFNKKFEELTKRSKEAIIGKIPWEVFPNLKNSAIEKNIRKAMAGDVISGREVMVSPQDEKTTWLRESYSPIKDDGECVVGVVTVANEITERKEYEEKLRRLRNYLANIFDSMPSQLIGVDKNGCITQWNYTIEQKTGISAGDAQGKTVTEVLPWMASQMRKISESIASRKTIQEQRIPRNRDDSFAYEDITIFPLTANGVEGAVIRVDDVTERVRMEEMMVQSEKMLSVGGLAAGMAHEINNPLAGMLQTAEVMANRLGGNPDIPANRRAAEAAGITLSGLSKFMEARGIPRMLGAISESGKRVAGIVQNMLSFARKTDAAVSSFHLGDLLDATVELAAHDYDLKKEYDFKRIEIAKEYAEDLPEVPCEGGKIQQVLLNIFRNGAQAMQEAGIASPRFIFRTRLDEERGMAVVEIEDNGPGMDEEIRKRVFEPFFTTKPVGVGTGLGLSVSYFIITENHGGDMTVDSRPGAGATFIIRLPLHGIGGPSSAL